MDLAKLGPLLPWKENSVKCGFSASSVMEFSCPRLDVSGGVSSTVSPVNS